eukprot:280394_1
MAAAPPSTIITINDYTPEEQIQLAFTKKLRVKSLWAFFCIIFLNFIFYVVLFSISGLVFIFPINDILEIYYDTNNGYNIAIFTIDCIILIFCVLSEVKLTEIHITAKSYSNWLMFYVILNFFYIFVTPILLLPVVKLLSISNCYSFKSQLNKFIKPETLIENNIQSITDNPQTETNINEETETFKKQITDEIENIQTKNDMNIMNIKLIASHHWLSKLCYKLKVESLKSQNKQPNNKTLYQILSEGLDNKLRDIMDRNDKNTQQLSFVNKQYSPKDIYRNNVIKKGRSYDFQRKVFLRLYLLAINISMIRLVFFNKNFSFREDYFGLYVTFWSRITIECILVITLLIVINKNEKIKQVATNRIGTQYYFAVLLSPEFNVLSKSLFDNLQDECMRFYKCWYYELYGIDTKIILSQWIGHDIGCIIFGFLFEDNDVLCFNDDGNLDISNELREKIKIVFPNPQ